MLKAMINRLAPVGVVIIRDYKLDTRKNISYTISNNIGDTDENTYSTAIFQAVSR